MRKRAYALIMALIMFVMTVASPLLNVEVYAAEDGTISKIYNDPMLGYTVEITHKDNIITKYSCLSDKDIGMISVGDVVVSGDRIGTVGDSSVSEMADEPHLHFSMLVGGVAVNPLDYITEDSQSASLGITENQ